MAIGVGSEGRKGKGEEKGGKKRKERGRKEGVSNEC